MSANAKHTLSMLGVVIDGLEVIQGLTKLGGDKAAFALEAIDRLVTRLKDGFDDPKIDPSAILKELVPVHEQIAAHNADIDKRLAAKFDNSDG